MYEKNIRINVDDKGPNDYFPLAVPQSPLLLNIGKKQRFLIFRGLEQNSETARGKRVIHIRIRIDLKNEIHYGHGPLRHV